MNSKNAVNVLIPVCLIAVGAGLWRQWPTPPSPPALPSQPTVQLPPPLPQPKHSPQADVTDAASFEFDGVLVAGGKATVSLVNLTTGDANWVAVGGKFDGYTVSKYVPDPKGADVVELTKNGGGQTMRVGLKNAVILEAPPVPDPSQIAKLIAEGRSEYLGGDLAAASDSFKEVLSIDPQNSEAVYFLTRIAVIAGGKYPPDVGTASAPVPSD
jgi:hypothetical protein